MQTFPSYIDVLIMLGKNVKPAVLVTVSHDMMLSVFVFTCSECDLLKYRYLTVNWVFKMS